MFPIKTIKHDDSITKVVIEDFSKTLSRILKEQQDYTKKLEELINSFQNEVRNENGDLVEGTFIIGSGTAKPAPEDVFDEEIGNEIAFRKAKLFANLKKIRKLFRIISLRKTSEEYLNEQLRKLRAFVMKDEEALRKYNPEFDYFL